MKKEKQNPQIEELNQKIGELTAGWQRTQADFQNFRRQVEEDRKKLIKKANTDLIMEILPVLDNFQLAAKHVPTELESNNWVIGVKQIEKQLESILENSGLSKIPTVGEQFNPHLHEAIEHIQSDEPIDIIVEELTSGYKFDDSVLRPAKVKVSAGK
ncbi:MAG: nucleotide exchange factor GrpE [Patescibacteria group bacterium]